MSGKPPFTTLPIKNLLGYPKVRLYEGSMTAGSALSQYPIETAGKLVQTAPKSATTWGV